MLRARFQGGKFDISTNMSDFKRRALASPPIMMISREEYLTSPLIMMILRDEFLTSPLL